MVNTRIACGIVGDDLMVRVGPDGHDDAKARGATEMDFTGRPMRGMVIVSVALLTNENELDSWIDPSRDLCPRPTNETAEEGPEPTLIED